MCITITQDFNVSSLRILLSNKDCMMFVVRIDSTDRQFLRCCLPRSRAGSLSFLLCVGGGVCRCAGHLWIMLAGMACRYTWEGVSVCWAPVDHACRYGMQVHMGGCVSVLGTCGSCLQVWHAGTHALASFCFLGAPSIHVFLVPESEIKYSEVTMRSCAWGNGICWD